MIPELGNFAQIIALCLAIALAIVPMAGVVTNNQVWMDMSRSLSSGIWVFMLLSFACLGWAFLQDDFSVAYVANNSNSMLPSYYKFTAIWGGHEGSMLLWVLILATWTWLVSVLNRGLPVDMLARVLSVMGLITTGFLLFTIMTSNPFDRLLLNTPADGSDLNPLLQDFGLIVHPPFLYMGYVGFSVAFSFAIAALLSGRLDAAWARWMRPWTNAAWAFLTIGIALGSWWAYYELGWGGWWFWDPVENVSVMPWLVGTALIHSLAAPEKRGAFKSWTVLLAIAAFSLSLLGAFIVRSGVLTSVHAFAVDPERGMLLLILMLVVIGGSLTLYALRAPAVRGAASYSITSREVFLLINNIILVVATAAVLAGTLAPLIDEAISGEANRISVGPPYFNLMFLPLMALLAVVLGAGAITRWKNTSLAYMRRQLGVVAVAAVVLGILLPLLITREISMGVMLAVALALWIIGVIVRDVLSKCANKPSLLKGLRSLGRAYWGMQLAHLGFAVTILGVCITSVYSIERDVRMSPGDDMTIGGYQFVFEGVEDHFGPNYVSDYGTVRVLRDGRELTTLHPEKRTYVVTGTVQTEASINTSLFRDLFVALGDPRGDEAWVVRLHVKPFVLWIWLGAGLMAAGGVLAVLDRRYRRRRAKAMDRSGSSDTQISGTTQSGQGAVPLETP